MTLLHTLCVPKRRKPAGARRWHTHMNRTCLYHGGVYSSSKTSREAVRNMHGLPTTAVAYLPHLPSADKATLYVLASNWPECSSQCPRMSKTCCRGRRYPYDIVTFSIFSFSHTSPRQLLFMKFCHNQVSNQMLAGTLQCRNVSR